MTTALENAASKSASPPDDSALHDLLFRRVSDAILIAQRDGTIVKVNPAAAAMLGQPMESLVGKTPAALFRQHPALVNLFTRTGEQAMEIHWTRRRLLSGSALTLDDGRRLVILRDVTEQRDLNSRREQLIAQVAHDLRNPIAAMSGFTELVGKVGDLNDEQTTFLTRARQMAVRLHEVITTITDLAWLESGMPIQHVPVQINHALDKAIASVEGLAQSRALNIAVSLQNPLPLVMGDPLRIQQVIEQLLRNALLYSEPERLIAVHAWGDTVEVYCSVADRGFGISDNDLELIFDRLYRSRDERIQAVAGAGLGLTIAKRILVRHGGDIWASSNLGKGSTFTFVLPAAQSG